MSLVHSSPESRRMPREAVDCQTRIWSGTLAPTPALIVDISPQGCQVHSDQAVPTGERVTVQLPGIGDLHGIAAWSQGTRIGIEFEAGIPLEPYHAMLSLIKPSAPTR